MLLLLLLTGHKNMFAMDTILAGKIKYNYGDDGKCVEPDKEDDGIKRVRQKKGCVCV